MDEPTKKLVSFKPGRNKDILQIALDNETAQDLIFALEEAKKTYTGDYYYNLSGTITIVQP